MDGEEGVRLPKKNALHSKKGELSTMAKAKEVKKEMKKKKGGKY